MIGAPRPASGRANVTPAALAPAGEPLAGLDRAIPLPLGVQIAADPDATPAALARILLTAPRLAAVQALVLELGPVVSSPEERQWVVQRLAASLDPVIRLAQGVSVYSPTGATADFDLPAQLLAPVARLMGQTPGRPVISAAGAMDLPPGAANLPEALGAVAPVRSEDIMTTKATATTLSEALDLSMALKALAESARTVDTPLTRLIRAAQAPAPSLPAQGEAPVALAAPAAAQAREIVSALEALRRDPSPVAREVAERLLAGIEQSQSELRKVLAAAPDRADALLWAATVMESRLATAPWALAPRMSMGWAEILFGLASRVLSRIDAPLPGGIAPAVGPPSGGPAGAPGVAAPPPAAMSSGLQSGIPLPASIARDLAAIIPEMRDAPHRRWRAPVRELLASLARGLESWDGELAGALDRQNADTQAALARLAQRATGLGELIDAQRLHNVRAFDTGQPVTLWLPLAMNGERMQARIDYAAEFGGRRGRRRSGAYNVVVSLDLTQAGPLQLRCHVSQRRVSLEVASPMRRLREIAQELSGPLKTRLEARGFALERFEVSDSFVAAELLAAAAGPGFHAMAVSA